MRRLVFVCAFLCALVELQIAFAQPDQIHVGPNVHVSQADATYPLGEIMLSADPADANHLLGCGIVYGESENRRWTVAYLSMDGGETWRSTLDTKRFEDSSDEACALGRNGLALHIAIGRLLNPATKITSTVLGVYRSTDGGRTWMRPEDMPMKFQLIERESLAIDNRSSRSADTVYIAGSSWIRGLAHEDATGFGGFGVWRSRDGGVTFDGPLKRAAAVNQLVLEPGSSAVLSDGTLVSLIGILKNYKFGSGVVARSTSEESNAVLYSVLSTDGGENLSEAVKVDDFFMVWGQKDSGALTLGMPMLAADPGDGPFRDRLYATWGDERGGRPGIRLAYSSDKGKTWSKSVLIDDVPTPADKSEGAKNFLPTVAVNKAGVVAVTWYDRRDNPDGLGWYVRLRASLDGGDTWLPSIRVSEKPNTFSHKLFTFANAPGQYGYTSDEKDTVERPIHVTVGLQLRQFYAGDYAGLAADASGTFHALWIDDRTGLAQIWSAPIVVLGKAIRNGDAALAALTDVSGEVQLKIVSSKYDRESNAVLLGIRLQNSSRESIRGPVKLRLVNVSSTIGNPSAANADNELTRPGAVWDFSSLLTENVLKPGETSPVRQLVFHINNPRDFFDGKILHTDLLNFDIRVLAAGAESLAKAVRDKPE